jgi:hypothetical protein
MNSKYLRSIIFFTLLENNCTTYNYLFSAIFNTFMEYICVEDINIYCILKKQTFYYIFHHLKTEEVKRESSFFVTKMFSTKEYLDRKTGPDGVDRFNYLQALVNEYRDTQDDGMYY